MYYGTPGTRGTDGGHGGCGGEGGPHGRSLIFGFNNTEKFSVSSEDGIMIIALYSARWKI